MKIGTIGSGFIVDHFINAGRKVPGVEFVAVSSRSQERANEFAEKHKINKAYGSIEAMLMDDEVDTVYVASPNSLHYSQTIQAIQAGKHVIVEKPFAGNLARAYEIFKAASDNGVYVFEAITTVHLPNYAVVKEALATIGPISIVSANMSQYSSRYDALLRGENPNVFNPDFSGGALADLNIYNIHFVVGLFGKPNSIYYSARRHVNGVDVSGVVSMEYDNFAVSLIGAKDSVAPNFVQIQAENGLISIPSSSSMITKVNVTNDLGHQEHNLQNEPQHLYQIKAFQEIIESDDKKRYNQLTEHTLSVVEVVEKARQSIGMYYEY